MTEDLPQINPAPARGIYNRAVKRCIDIIIALLVMVVLCWLYAILAIIVRIESPGHAIFRQQRIGRNGKVFNLYKFRSMYKDTEHTGSGVYSNSQDARLTKIGRFMRKTSLDELPQMLNMLKGDMSLIGPRPPLTYHPWPYEEYNQRQVHMFDVRPGLTGWAQIHGRRTVEWNTRIEYNLYYVSNVSFGLDIRIFFATFGKLFKRSENENQEATVQEVTIQEATVQEARV